MSSRINPKLIYVLKCPLNKQIRYVGKTENSLKARLRQHCHEATRTDRPSRCHRANWIKSLALQGLKPLIELDVIVGPQYSWKDVEVERIAYHRRMGADLTNSTLGGDCPAPLTDDGRKILSQRASAQFGSPEARKIQSERMSKLCEDQEWVSRRAEAAKASRRAPEYRKALSDRTKALWDDPDFKAKMLGRNYKDPEYVRKQSEAMKRHYADPNNRAKASRRGVEAWVLRKASENQNA